MRAETVLRLVSGALQDLEPGQRKRWSWEPESCAPDEDCPEQVDQSRSVCLLDFLNSAVHAVCLQRPDVTATTSVIALSPGRRQRIPKDASMLIELIRNMGEDGHTPGPAILPVQMDVLMAWADGRTGKLVENYAYDRTTNKDMYLVYPAVSDRHDVRVEATYSRIPQPLCQSCEEVGLPDTYAEALFHHMLASILGGDNESSNAAKASYHTQMFHHLLGLKLKVDSAWPQAHSRVRVSGA